jgi:hypothetical protein
MLIQMSRYVAVEGVLMFIQKRVGDDQVDDRLELYMRNPLGGHRELPFPVCQVEAFDFFFTTMVAR